MHDYLEASDWQRIQRIEKALESQKGLLVALERATRQQKPGRAARRVDPGMTLIKMAAAYARDEGAEAIEAIRRSAVAPADTVTPGWAAELVQSIVAGFVLSIAGQSAYAALAARTEPLRFGRNGSQAVSYGGGASAGFVGEGGMIPVTSGTIGKLFVRPKKIAAIATFSSETAKSASFETVLGALLRDAAAKALDAVFFGDAAGSPAQPPGVLVGLTAIPPSSAIDPVRAMAADMAGLVAALDSPRDPCFVMSPAKRLFASANIGPRFDYPVFASSAIPNDRLVCVDAAALTATHGDTPDFLAGNEMMIEEQDADDIVSPIMSGSPVRSMWQTDTRALQVTLECAWAIRPGGAAFTEAVTW
ncbi:hypothetical protein [Sinorhizobium meliloti]|uniref:hypothetical protein n=1 Tax=Rhizobium meliloti TaxID=382 RepID=UPI000410276C|nr:hypothetical protein [Sinorhizobium meliloti]